MMKQETINIIGETGLLLLRCVFCVLLLFSLSWHLNLPIVPIVWPVSFIIASIPLLVHRRFKAIFLSLLAMVFFIALSMLLWDYSADGQWYHMPAAWALAHGWNPILQHHNTMISPLLNANLWIDHYCKGMEALSASIISLSGNTEAGKAVNLFFLAITFSLSYVTLYKLWRLSGRKTLFYALILSFSPIVCTEVFTFYIDLACYDCVIWLLCLLFLLDNHCNCRKLVYVFMVVYIGCSIKTNLSFWMGFFVFIFLLYSFVKRRFSQAWKIACTSLFAVVLMLFTIGFNPLITNIEDHGNPLYPFGNQEEDPTEAIIQGAQPKYMVGSARWKQILIGMTSRPDGGYLTGYTAPWKLTGRNLSHAGSMTCNVGGGAYSSSTFFFCLWCWHLRVNVQIVSNGI